MNLKQEVFVEIYNSVESDNILLGTSELRVDFDIRMIPNFNVAKVTIYNLNNDNITMLAGGDKYLTLKVRSYGGEKVTLMNKFRINNMVDELVMPNRITSLFCQSWERVALLEKPIDETTVYLPSLKNCVENLKAVAEFKGKIDYISFPAGKETKQDLRVVRTFSGNFIDALKELGSEFDFNFYVINGDLKLMHKPDLRSVGLTDLNSRETVVFKTDAMRSNPKVGIASAVIDSILDPNINPTTVIDLSNLITVGVDENDLRLQVTPDNYLKSFSSYTRYQAFTTQHRGSNYTSDWNTVINAISPTDGKLSPTVAWAQINKD